MFKKQTKAHIRIVSFLLIFTLTHYIVSPSYPVSALRPAAWVNLCPQMRSGPLLDKDLGDAHILASFIMYNLKEAGPGSINSPDKMNDLFSDLGTKTVEALFSKAESIEFKNNDAGGKEGTILLVPCRVDSQPFYAYVILYKDGRTRIGIHTQKEYAEHCKALLEKGKLSAEEFSRLRRALPLAAPDIAVVHRSDKSVSLAAGFFEKIYSGELKQRLGELLDGGKLLIAGGPALASGGLILDRSRHEQDRAWSIIEQLLTGQGILQPERDRFRAAFEKYCENMDSFDLGSFDPGLGLLVLVIAARGVKLAPEAYTQMTDISDVDTTSDGYHAVVRDVEKVFRDVAFYEMGLKEKNGDGNVRKIPEAKLPYKVVIERLSDHVLPESSITEENGIFTIRVNENFVKLMYKLSELGLRGRKGGIRDVYEDKYADEVVVGGTGSVSDWIDAWSFPEDQADLEIHNLGNLYFSILYSVALYDIRGRFKVKNGAVVLNLDEEFAAGERGEGHLYVNLIAMSVFWFAILQNSYDFYSKAFRDFMINNSGIFNGLEQEKKDMIADVVENLLLFWEFDEDFHEPQSLARIPAPTPAAVFRLLGEGPATVREISDRFGGAGPEAVQETVTRSLADLMRFGVINEAVFRNGDVVELSEFKEFSRREKREPVYEILPMTGDQLGGAQGILDELVMSPGEEEFKKARTRMRILALMEPVWARAVAKEVERQEARAAKEEGGKVLIAIETGWIPDEQDVFIKGLVQEVDKLGRGGCVQVIRGPADTLAGRLMDTVRKERIPLTNVVVLAGRDTIEREEFAPIRARNDGDTDKAFLVGVDARDLTRDSYIRLMEMLTMALRMAFGRVPLSDHPAIEVNKLNSRLVIFIPKAEPLDLYGIKKLYDSQKTVLAAA